MIGKEWKKEILGKVEKKPKIAKDDFLDEYVSKLKKAKQNQKEKAKQRAKTYFGTSKKKKLKLKLRPRKFAPF